MTVDRLKELGLKLTPQRLAVLTLLRGDTTHPSAEEVYNRLKPRFPSLSLATVYNVLEVLVRAGEVKEVKVAGDRRHFDPNVAPHGHFVCRVCRSIFDLAPGSGEIEKLFDLTGYVAEEYAFCVYGVCPGCREKSSG